MGLAHSPGLSPPAPPCPHLSQAQPAPVPAGGFQGNCSACPNISSFPEQNHFPAVHQQECQSHWHKPWPPLSYLKPTLTARRQLSTSPDCLWGTSHHPPLGCCCYGTPWICAGQSSSRGSCARRAAGGLQPVTWPRSLNLYHASVTFIGALTEQCSMRLCWCSRPTWATK